jgi:1,4-alpha-glucan branching enzyme
MRRGYWLGVLHSHLPFVKHPEFDYFFEEQWFFEAIVECYIPLLQNLQRLEEEGVYVRLTVSVTPPLVEMFNDGMLMEKFERHLQRQLELADKELFRLEGDPFYETAAWYHARFRRISDFYYGFLGRNLLNGYRYFEQNGMLEIITCGATHGFLPLMSVNEKAVEVQIAQAVKVHTQAFGKAPRGIWLPECAYYDGLDAILKAQGIEYFFMDSHGVALSTPSPKYGVFAPVFTPEGVCAFGRDPESSKQVWSSKEGYPGDFRYRDFYRDIGYDLPFEYISPYLDPIGTRGFTGFKYYKITAEGGDKHRYDPYAAQEAAQSHARNFHFNRERQINYLSGYMERAPLIVSPYDAELFGHWWFEGPDFLYHFFKECHEHGLVEPINALHYLDIHPQNQVVLPNPSSWGDRGYFDVWINGGNDWIYRHLHLMSDRMCECAQRYGDDADPVRVRALNQMARELLLAQSSDWAFLMTTGTAAEYSVERTKEHISNFNALFEMVNADSIEQGTLERWETKNSIFPSIDFRIYR